MSEIITDKLTGKTSAGDVTITSEGGSATMQLQQGVAKAWANFQGNSTAVFRDGFNNSSLTDNGAGDYTVTFTNVMDNANHANSGMVIAQSTSYLNGPMIGNSASYTMVSGSIRVTTNYAGSGASNREDRIYVNVTTHGDLA